MNKILVIAFNILMIDTALAQQTSTVQLDSVSSVLMPILLAVGSAAATVITAVGVYAVGWVRKKLNLTDQEAAQIGLQIDAHQREALQTALTNAAGLALNKLQNDIKGKTIDVRNPAVADAVNSVLRSAPDAISYFKLDKQPAAIAEKIVAKIPQVANTTTAV